MKESHETSLRFAGANIAAALTVKLERERAPADSFAQKDGLESPAKRDNSNWDA
jgi:hypothetical protein